VVIILEELGLSYRTVHVDANAGDNKRPPYTTLNPNGRMPTLIDHGNDDFVIWESGAIILYLIEKYDTGKKLSFDKFESNAIAKQYLMFQMSGQGPYFGQAAWFKVFHAEKVPSAIERYEKEINRVLGVLNDILTDKEYLVEDRISYADLSFVTWLGVLEWDSMGKGEWKKNEKFAAVKAWYERLTERESVKTAMVIKASGKDGVFGVKKE